MVLENGEFPGTCLMFGRPSRFCFLGVLRLDALVPIRDPAQGVYSCIQLSKNTEHTKQEGTVLDQGPEMRSEGMAFNNNVMKPMSTSPQVLVTSCVRNDHRSLRFHRWTERAFGLAGHGTGQTSRSLRPVAPPFCLLHAVSHRGRSRFE
eukprot:754334-Hanusia_phi.AAC.2